jgi:hypothetical protein
MRIERRRKGRMSRIEKGTRKVSGIYKSNATIDKYNITGERSEELGIADLTKYFSDKDKA